LTITTIANAKPVVLVAPLDWGLGHTTRCIPVIEECLSAGFEVIIATEGSQKTLLQCEFPNLNIVNLRGYRLSYASGRWLTIIRLMLQIPKILIAINSEHKWLNNFIKEKHLDIIIADNRYGLYAKSVFSIFITHQLSIKTLFGKWTDKIIQLINYRFIQRFNVCWVPDIESKKNLGGDLSHPLLVPSCEIRYVGILSRIKKTTATIKNKLLVLLSGPEPQRSILENNLLQQLKFFSIPTVFIRGLPLSADVPEIIPSVEILNHVSGKHLEQIINESEIIISRSGYTTIMEVLPLNKKCIFFPTPGQSEQEYLANYLAEKGWACIASQNKFSLPAIVKEAEALRVPDLSDFSDSIKLKIAISDLKDKISK
jgi:uncharacterized protein (TIGR00661 family)